MPTSRRYPPEIRERTVRLVFEHEQDYPSQWSAIRSIAEKSGMTAETVRKWVRQAERDSGRRPGLSTEERDRLRGLEKENKELRRANEILKAAAAFFGAELDRRPGRSATPNASQMPAASPASAAAATVTTTRSRNR